MVKIVLLAVAVDQAVLPVSRVVKAVSVVLMAVALVQNILMRAQGPQALPVQFASSGQELLAHSHQRILLTYKIG